MTDEQKFHVACVGHLDALVAELAVHVGPMRMDQAGALRQLGAALKVDLDAVASDLAAVEAARDEKALAKHLAPLVGALAMLKAPSEHAS